MELNTYDTFCEAPKCRESVIQRAANFEAAIEHIRTLGWWAVKRDATGYAALCPTHKEGRTETMQRCSACGGWCSRTLNICPTCDAHPLHGTARSVRLIENAISITADVFQRGDDSYAEMRNEWDDKIGGYMGWTSAIAEAAEALTAVEDSRDLYASGEGLDWYTVTSMIADRLAADPREDAAFMVECALRDSAPEQDCGQCPHSEESHEHIGGKRPWLCHECDDGSASPENIRRAHHAAIPAKSDSTTIPPRYEPCAMHGGSTSCLCGTPAE